MFLKPVWVGKIHGVGVYATHVVRIWWFRNKFSIQVLKKPLLIPESFQDIFFSIFGRSENSRNCFQDLLTFI